MAENQVERRNSGSQLLQEIEALSHSLYQSHTARRTASLSLPPSAEVLSGAGLRGQADDVTRRKRSSTSTISGSQAPEVSEVRGRTRRMSLSPWRSRPKADDRDEDRRRPDLENELPAVATAAAADRKKGIWNWKPMRALSHIGMQKLSVLFSVEVVAVQGVPASMNGLRLAVCVRKQETKDGALQTMPSRVMQGAADFEETLFLRCHVYFSSSKHSPGVFRFEQRPFLVTVVAVDAEELDFGRNVVDLSNLVQESMERNVEGARVRQWDATFKLSGKAKGAELVLKLGFQIMEKDGGIFKMEKAGDPFVRKQSKASFSVPSSNVGSPRITAIVESPKSARSQALRADLQKIEHLNLDDDDDDQPAPLAAKSHEPEDNAVDDLPEFEVVDKGVEIQKPEKAESEPEVAESEENEGSASSEVVKEVVEDRFHKRRLTELDAIAEQIKALESLIGDDKRGAKEDELDLQNLDAEEETVTREFLQMLEEEGEAEPKSSGFQFLNDPSLKMGRWEEDDGVGLVFLPDLGKGLGSVVQTRDGGFLAAANPLNVAISRKAQPELAIQVTKPIVFPVNTGGSSGFDIVQKLAALGAQELSTRPFSLMPIDDLSRKAPEQIAFEGIASAVIGGRNKEVASSSAARSVAIIKKITAAMNSGRKERVESGIWNAEEEPVTINNLMASALQKIEAVAVEALKIQADMADDEPPFDISAIVGKPDPAGSVFTNAVQVDRWEQNWSANAVSLAALVQLRDPSRQLEAVGAPMLVIVQAVRFSGSENEEYEDEEEEIKFKATSVHVAGLKVRQGGKRNLWDGDRQRLTAAQWLVAHGLGKSGKKEKQQGRVVKGPADLFWSLSARAVAGLWLKPTRNPDIKFPKQTAPVS
ncbi:hypothetical protein EJ110_NYTH07754 [Nymphaea thermarum]|nr:hypothetical protein EJ110_NYTH07754 [Nymphaea thermarum]